MAIDLLTLISPSFQKTPNAHGREVQRLARALIMVQPPISDITGMGYQFLGDDGKRYMVAFTNTVYEGRLDHRINILHDEVPSR